MSDGTVLFSHATTVPPPVARAPRTASHRRGMKLMGTKMQKIWECVHASQYLNGGCHRSKPRSLTMTGYQYVFTFTHVGHVFPRQKMVFFSNDYLDNHSINILYFNIILPSNVVYSGDSTSGCCSESSVIFLGRCFYRALMLLRFAQRSFFVLIAFGQSHAMHCGRTTMTFQNELKEFFSKGCPCPKKKT